MNKAGFSKEYPQNFFLNEQKLRKIIDVITDHTKKLNTPFRIQYKVFRDNDSFYESESLDELLSDDNTLSKKIRKISIYLYITEPKKEEKNETNILALSFGKRREIPILLDVEYSNKQWCFILLDDLDTQIKRTLKNSFHFSGTIFGAIDVLAFFLLTALIIALAISNAMISIPENIFNLPLEDKIDYLIRATAPFKPTNKFSIFAGTLLGIIPFSFLVFSPISKGLKFFSSSTFYWGDERVYFDKKQKIINYIFFGVILTIIIGIITTFITKKIGW
ncbi:hypothetical protein AAIR98_000627 [Elusimicrobium simillimum]|uniref:hypothetical protein n=1 Tax=Elusimicrobium simillimum TaxID=3143438 RepID=UPI003C701420